jgi:hypothetical protein
MLSFNLSVALVCALLARNAISHPGHDPAEEIAERAEYLNQASRRSLSHCSEALKTRGFTRELMLVAVYWQRSFVRSVALLLVSLL